GVGCDAPLARRVACAHERNQHECAGKERMIDGIIEQSVHKGRALYQRKNSLINQLVDLVRRSGAALASGVVLSAFGQAANSPADPEKELREVREKIEAMQRSMRRDTDRRDALSGQ